MTAHHPHPGLRLCWRVDPRRLVRILLLVTILLFIAGLAGQLVRFSPWSGILGKFTPMFNLDWEMNVPTWYASALFALCGLLLHQVAVTDGVDGRRWKWRLLAGAFFLCSIDEVATGHEMLIRPLRVLFHARGVFHYAWVIPALILLALMAIFFAPLFLRLPSSIKKTFVCAAAVFISGAIGMEMAGGAFVEGHGSRNLTYSIITHVEEVLELLGQILFIRGALQLLAACAGKAEDGERPG